MINTDKHIKEYNLLETDLNIIWEDGSESCFDYLWLRDNCPSAFHPITHERNFNLLSVPEDIKPEKIETKSGQMVIHWNNLDVSNFDIVWLAVNDYSNDHDEESEKNFKCKSWKKEYINAIYKVDAEKLLGDENELLKWLTNLHNNGLVLVSNMKDQPNALEEIAGLVSHLRETNFGLTFDVMSKPNPNNQAYTAEALPLHTDLPNQELPPGFQFLHCINNESTGGESTFVDGFAVAEYLRDNDPESFKLLSENLIPFRFHDDTHNLFERKVVISCVEGEIDEVNFNAHIATTFQLPKKLMRPYYLAYRNFMTVLNMPDFLIKFKLESGDMVVFDNRRVLHGRQEFDPNTGMRHLRGCYVDRGDLKSKIRVLKKRVEGRNNERN